MCLRVYARESSGKECVTETEVLRVFAIHREGKSDNRKSDCVCSKERARKGDRSRKSVRDKGRYYVCGGE
jgi:hypothetical protein